MIWTDNWNQVPAGNMVGVATIGGQQYQVWQSGSGDGGILTYVSVIPQTSGTMPLAAFFADVRARGWTPTTTWQVDYGVEVVDTNGNPERFAFTDFSVDGWPSAEVPSVRYPWRSWSDSACSWPWPRWPTSAYEA